MELFTPGIDFCKTRLVRSSSAGFASARIRSMLP
jgi:hypothetical protein